MRIISLSSIPPRFATLRLTLETLLEQAADDIRVYIPQQYRRFPDWDGKLPDVPAGVQIHRCEHDHGPATKFLPAARELVGRNAQLLFCDDDQRYHRRWADQLFSIQARRPRQAVAVRVQSAALFTDHPVRTLGGRPPLNLPRLRDMPFRLGKAVQQRVRPGSFGRRFVLWPGYSDILLAYAGAVIRPEFLDDMPADVPEHLRLFDDVWISAHLARRGIPIYCPAGVFYPLVHSAEAVSALYNTIGVDSADGVRNYSRAVRACQRELGVWQPA